MLGFLFVGVALTPLASAATGDMLQEVVLGQSTPRGVAFDGEHVFTTRSGSTLITVRTTDGTAVRSVDPGFTIQSLEWDPLRGLLWGGAASGGGVHLVDPATGASTLQFTYNPAGGSNGNIVGLTHDRYTDTLYVRESASNRVAHVATDGVQLGLIPVSAAATGIEFDGDALWVGVLGFFDTSSRIIRYDLAGTNTLEFRPGVYPADLALDPFAFAPECGLWAGGARGVWALTYVLRTFEVTMPCGDKVAPTTVAGYAGATGNAGWFVSDVTATLSATDGPADWATGVAATTFTLDGAAGTYTAPVAIAGDGTHSFAFASQDRAGNTEGTHEATVRIDTVAPATAASRAGPAGDNGWFTGDVTVTLTASDATSGVAATTYAVDGASAAYTAPFAVAGDGVHDVTFGSTDVAGNGEATHALGVSIDSVAPESTATLTGLRGNDGWFVSEVTLALAATDVTSGVARTLVSVNGGAESEYAGAVVFAQDGWHVVTYRSVDVAGNTESAATVEFMIDQTAPVTDAAVAGAAGDNGWWLSDVSVTLVPSDATSGVASTTFTLDAGPEAAYAGPVAVAGDGGHALTFSSTDVAGNAEAPTTLVIEIDTVAPATGASAAGASGSDGWFTSDVTVTLAATDATSGVAVTSYAINGGDGVLYAGPFTVSADGVHDVAFFSRDVAGNVEQVQHLEVKVDQTLPVTVLDIGEPQAVVDGDLYVSPATTFTLTATDGTSGVAATWFTINGGAPQAYSEPFTLGSDDGTYTVAYWSEDAASNVETAGSVTVRLDGTLPLVVITTPRPASLSVGEHYLELDSDVDGYPDPVELEYGSDPFAADSTPVLPHVAEAAATPAVSEEVGPVPVETEDESADLPDASQTVDVPVATDPEHVGDVPGVDEQVGPAQVFLPPTSIAVPAIGPFDPVTVDLPARSVTVPGQGPVAAQPVVVPSQTAGPVGGSGAPGLADSAYADAAGRAFVIGGTVVPVTAASTDPVVGGVASGVAFVVFLVDGDAVVVDAEAPFGFAYDTDGVAAGDHLVEAVSVDRLGHATLTSVRVFVLPATEAGARTTARLAFEEADGAARAVLAPADDAVGLPTVTDGNADAVPDGAGHAGFQGAGAGGVDVRASDAVSVADASGDGYVDGADGAVAVGADATLPEAPSVASESVEAGPVGGEDVPAQEAETPGVVVDAGDVQAEVPAQSAATPAAEVPVVGPVGAETPAAGGEYPDGVPPACAGSGAVVAPSATFAPTRVDLPNGAFVVLLLPAPDATAAAAACGDPVTV